MGGSAFSALLPASAFPRLPRAVYQGIKSRYLPRLSKLYKLAAVLVEAPGKSDYGDLDLLVAIPKPPHGLSISHEMVKTTLGAEYTILLEGNRTSNYAVPIQTGEWADFGHAAEEEEKRSATKDGKIFYQIDVCVCNDEAEWERLYFFNSYGDLGMILGLIAKNCGLALGSKGLKLPDIPNPPFDLSNSFGEITEFLGLSFMTYSKGFQTQEDVFNWVASIKYFDARYFRSSGPGISKVKEERTMYAAFVKWVEETKPSSRIYSELPREERIARIREDAFLFFNKKDEYEQLLRTRRNKAKFKEVFSGHNVRDWTDLGEYWKGVKMIMDEVRVKLGGDEGIAEFLDGNAEEDLKTIVLKVQGDLGIYRRQTEQTL